MDRAQTAYVSAADAADPECFRVLCKFAAWACAAESQSPDSFRAVINPGGYRALEFNKPAARNTFWGISSTTFPEEPWVPVHRSTPPRFSHDVDYRPKELPPGW